MPESSIDHLTRRWENNRVAISNEADARRRRELVVESYEIALEAERVGWFRLPRPSSELLP